MADNLQVKVGGTIMDIDAFVMQYSAVEAAKFKRKKGLKDRLKRKFNRQRQTRSTSRVGASPGARSNSSLLRNSVKI
jgi:hypothetical protein